MLCAVMCAKQRRIAYRVGIRSLDMLTQRSGTPSLFSQGDRLNSHEIRLAVSYTPRFTSESSGVYFDDVSSRICI